MSTVSTTTRKNRLEGLGKSYDSGEQKSQRRESSPDILRRSSNFAPGANQENTSERASVQSIDSRERASIQPPDRYNFDSLRQLAQESHSSDQTDTRRYGDRPVRRSALAEIDSNDRGTRAPLEESAENKPFKRALLVKKRRNPPESDQQASQRKRPDTHELRYALLIPLYELSGKIDYMKSKMTSDGFDLVGANTYPNSSNPMDFNRNNFSDRRPYEGRYAERYLDKGEKQTNEEARPQATKGRKLDA